jgi:hypothetical protein
VIIIRLWDYRLLQYLPDAQFKGQLREMVAILHDLKNKGKTNHLLINRVTDFTPRNFTSYFLIYREKYINRYGKDIDPTIVQEFLDWGGNLPTIYGPFAGWHGYEYVRVCMANLYEKHYFGVGKSRITDQDWKTLCDGYEKITGEPYKI